MWQGTARVSSVSVGITVCRAGVRRGEGLRWWWTASTRPWAHEGDSLWTCVPCNLP